MACVKGLEECREGGQRCQVCFELRLRETARLAKEAEADYFTTTLTISPLKNAAKINEIGQRLGKEFGIFFLPSDFKKKDGYKRSVELSAKYGLYRQDYCGCVYSKEQKAHTGKGKSGIVPEKSCGKNKYNGRIEFTGTETAQNRRKEKRNGKVS